MCLLLLMLSSNLGKLFTGKEVKQLLPRLDAHKCTLSLDSWFSELLMI